MNQQTQQNIRNATQAYARLVDIQVPTEAELTGWLNKLATTGVSSAVCEELRSLGPIANWSAEPYDISFRDYVAENRSLHMVDYLAEHLSAADYAAWVEAIGNGPVLATLAKRG